MDRDLKNNVVPETLRRSSRIKAKDEASTHSAAAQQRHHSSQASFMGLPPELRMCIYDYLVNGGRIIEADAAGHTCINTGNGYFSVNKPPRLKCLCTEAISPQILATSRTVYTEAMPILYSSTEFHICLPAPRQIKPTASTVELLKLPARGIEHIKRIALIGIDNRMAVDTSPNHNTNAVLTWLTSHDIKPVEVRLCIGMFLGSFSNHTLRESVFRNVVTLPRVKRVFLELPRVLRPGEDSQKSLLVFQPAASAKILDCRRTLVAALHVHAQTLDVAVNIKDVSSDEWRALRNYD